MDILKKLLPLTVLLFSLMYIMVPEDGFRGDLDCFHNWTRTIETEGVGNIYYRGGVNYPPAYFYILKVESAIFGAGEKNYFFNRHIKLYSLLFDLTGVLLVLIAVKDKSRLYHHWAFLALNIAYLYNSVLWGQVDGIAMALNFACIYFAYRGKWPLAAIMFVVSFNLKIQSIIFLPLLLLMLIQQWSSVTRKKMAISFFALLASQAIIILPYLHKGKLQQLYDVFTNAVGFYPLISVNAANFWHLAYPNTNLLEASDEQVFMGLTFKRWGLILFAAVSLLYFWPLLEKVYRKFRSRITIPFTFEEVMLVAALTPLTLFFFATQMHERYSHNAWLFIAAWSFTTRKYFPLVLFSICYFLNMELVLNFIFKLREMWFFNMRFIAALFAILIIYLLNQIRLTRSDA